MAYNKIARKLQYDLVWSTPMTTLSNQLNKLLYKVTARNAIQFVKTLQPLIFSKFFFYAFFSVIKINVIH